MTDGGQPPTPVSVSLFLVFLALGAGAIALWVDVRLKRFVPTNFRAVMLHVGASIVVGHLAVPVLTHLLAGGDSYAYAFVVIFAVGFPALTYCFLASIWMLKTLQASLRHR
jgi:hypothetical protein